MSERVSGLTTAQATPTIKCLVWDLDNTLWGGVLLEGGAGELLPGVRETIEKLDRRGILHSVASKNEPEAAQSRLAELGLTDYFLHPQIGWGAKSGAMSRIAGALNLGIDSLAFIDDQEFERDEVRFAHPAVLCLDACEVSDLPNRPEFQPPFVTEESALRRRMYLSAIARGQAEDDFAGTDQEFLSELGMVFRIGRARRDDLQRAEELTIRTHQLNSTGRTFSYRELEVLTRSPDHLVLVASLEDRYGGYGTIGLAVLETGAGSWRVLLLLMSCRVMSRGVGSVLLHQVQRWAADAGVTLRADFVPTDRNRIMYVTYRFAGFHEVERHDDGVVLEWAGGSVPVLPQHIRVVVDT